MQMSAITIPYLLHIVVFILYNSHIVIRTVDLNHTGYMLKKCKNHDQQLHSA